MLKRVIVAFLVILLFAMSAQAMTAQEFLSHNAENFEIAKYVLSNAEAGGLPFLILQAQEILEISKNSTDSAKADHARRTAFMHCAFASHLIKSGSKTERDKYEKSLINTLGQVMAAMGMTKQDELIKSLQGASAIYNDILYPGEKKDAQTQAPPALLEKYLGDYTYQNDTCGGKLVFSKAGKTGYTMDVETSCESGGTCGGVFGVVYSNEHNGIVTMKDAESGIAFAVGAKGISVANVPVHFCGRGAYMEGDYVRGKKKPAAKNAQTNTGGGMLEKLKDSHFPGFPANEGYQTIGDAFNSYFEDPKWEIQENTSSGDGYITHAVIFRGIAFANERKAMFLASLSWIFDTKEKKLTFYKCQFMLNGTRVHPREDGDILVNIMMDSKQSRNN